MTLTHDLAYLSPMGIVHRGEQQRTAQAYLNWLEAHVWRVTFSRERTARITLMYAECERKEEKA